MNFSVDCHDLINIQCMKDIYLAVVFTHRNRGDAPFSGLLVQTLPLHRPRQRRNPLGYNIDIGICLRPLINI